MVMGSSSSGGGGSEVAQAGTEKAPEAMSDLKMAAKRTTTAMGSSGSSPLASGSAPLGPVKAPGNVMHFECFLVLLFCVGLLTPASALHGVKSKCHAFSLGVRSLGHFRGQWSPKLSGRSGTRR
jgi:hypothetical protein